MKFKWTGGEKGEGITDSKFKWNEIENSYKCGVAEQA
jgi:hypothetical protein